MTKKQIRISIDTGLLREARDLGLDLGRILELAIERRVTALRALDKTDDLEAD